MNNTLNPTTVVRAKIRRPGAGRTKGTFSFVPITLEMLNAKFADKSFKILASRKQMEALGFTGLTTGAISDLAESVAGQSAETAVEIKTLEL